MKSKMKRGTIETYIIFLLSPLLSLPLIFFQLKKKDNSLIFLIALFFGLLSFLYIPSISNDKAEYYYRYDRFSYYNFNDFIAYLDAVRRPDFVFEFIIFFFAKIKVNIQYMFLGLTSFTIYSIFTFVKRVASRFAKEEFYFSIITVLLLIFSLSFSALLSGIRFYFGTSIFVWSIYHLFFDKNIRKGILLFLLTIVSHFSFAFFIPAIILLFFYPRFINPNFFLGISILFLFLPKDFLTNIFGFLQLPESYSTKADAYLVNERVASENSIILTLFRNLWLYFAYFYLLFINQDKTSKILMVLVTIMAFVNITYSVPIIFYRYAVVLKVLFLSYLLLQYKGKNIKLKYFALFVILFFINFVIDSNVLRYNYIASYELSNFYTIIHILSKKVVPNDFLQ